jgi:triacylglycerol lipase
MIVPLRNPRLRLLKQHAEYREELTPVKREDIGSGVVRFGIIRFCIGLALLVSSGHSLLAAEGVVLLHGLCRTDDSMTRMASALRKEGFIVLNVDYPSRTATVEVLAEITIRKALADAELGNLERIHFVTHSMGGILVRHYLKTNQIERLGRVVMLAPPNQGSEVVDHLGDLALFELINGPAGKQLGTSAQSLPNQLGPVNFELGIIAGDRSVNLINSRMIDGADDGKVSVARTKVDGMSDHIVLHVTHPGMMRNREVIRQTVEFLKEGKFAKRKKR